MPKQKPHKGLKKRVKVTGTGKVLRHRAFRGHLLSGKSGTRRQRLRRRAVVTGKVAATLKRALAVS
jgi:large subunit ribosomal protein L35